jgi:hypothetical protein
MIFRKNYFILIPVILGILGGLILIYEFDSYIPATSRLRVFGYYLIAYFISLVVSSIVSKRVLKINTYKNRLIIGLISLIFLSLINEIHFWNNATIHLKGWWSNPKIMLFNSSAQLILGVILLLIVNIRLKQNK